MINELKVELALLVSTILVFAVYALIIIALLGTLDPKQAADKYALEHSQVVQESVQTVDENKPLIKKAKRMIDEKEHLIDEILNY